MFTDRVKVRTHITDHYKVFLTVEVPKRDNYIYRISSVTVELRKFSDVNRTRLRELLGVL